MGQSDEYEALKALAREARSKYGVTTDTLGLRKMRTVYEEEGIHVDLWKHKLRRVQAAYLVVGGRSYVMLNAAQPAEPRLFSMAHELKHHYVDRDAASSMPIGCVGELGYSTAPTTEIGANIFAAEFIFPEAEFNCWALRALGKRACTKKEVVLLKRRCPARVSYAFLVRRLERLGFATKGAFAGVQFLNLEKQLFGPRYYVGRRH